MNFGKDSDLFLHRKQEASTTFVGLFPNLVYIRQDFLPYYIIYPYPIFFYTLHTRPYFAHILLFPVKGVKVPPLRLLEAQHAAPLLIFLL